jgi:hypothetical protein
VRSLKSQEQRGDEQIFRRKARRDPRCRPRRDRSREASLKSPRPEIAASWPPVEDQLQKWKRKANEQEERFARERAAAGLLTADAEAAARVEARLEQRLAGLVEQQRQFVLDVLAGVVAELHRISSPNGSTNSLQKSDCSAPTERSPRRSRAPAR